MDDRSRNALAKILKKHGIDVIDDPARLRGLLLDHCGESKKENSCFLLAVENRIPNTLLSTSDAIPIDITISRLVQSLAERTGLSNDSSRYAVESWALVLGKKLEATEYHLVDENSSSTIQLDRIPLIPIQITPSISITNLGEFPKCCDRYWDRILPQFINGNITDQILNSVNNLNITNRITESKKLRKFYKKAKEIETNALGCDDISKNVALEALVQSIGNISPPKIHVIPNELGLKVVEPGDRLTGNFTLLNNGRGYLYTELSLQENFIKVSPIRFGCFPDKGQDIEVIIDSSKLDFSTEKDVQIYYMNIFSNVGEKKIPIKIFFGRPRLKVSPLEIDFGVISIGEKINHSLIISNDGEAPLLGEIISSVECLKVLRKNFRLKQNEQHEAVLMIPTESLAKYKKEITQSNHIEVRSNGGSDKLLVQFKIGSPKLLIEQETLDFGQIFRGESAIETVLIKNAGSGKLHGEIKSNVVWLKIQPSSFICDPDKSIPLQVITRPYKMARSSEGDGDKTLCTIKSNGGDKTLPVHVEIVGPKLNIDPSVINIELTKSQEIRTRTLKLRNNSIKKLSGTIHSTESWLELTPQSFTCKPNSTARVNINIIKENISKYVTTNKFSTKVYIKPEYIKNFARVNLRLIPRLEVNTKNIKFSMMSNEKSDEKTIVITNNGMGHLSGDINPNKSWLKLSAKRFSLRAGESIEVKINAVLDEYMPDTYEGNITIKSNAGSKSLKVKLLCANVDKEKLVFQWAIDGIYAKKEVIITNWGNQFQANISCTEDWVKTSHSNISLASGENMTVLIWVDHKKLGVNKKKAYVNIGSINSRLSIQIIGDGETKPKYSSGIESCWGLISPNGSVVQTACIDELRKLVNEGYLLIE